MSTDLHKRMLAFRHDDPARDALMAEVWAPTPWMVDVYTGSPDGGRMRDMLTWCWGRWGASASPIHGRDGVWQQGGAIIRGWTWFGLATEAQMNEFLTAWPAETTINPSAR